jgi:hypothetical protein
MTDAVIFVHDHIDSWMINLKENGQPGSDHSKTILLAEHVDQSDMKHVRLSVAR